MELFPGGGKNQIVTAQDQGLPLVPRLMPGNVQPERGLSVEGIGGETRNGIGSCIGQSLNIAQLSSKLRNKV